MTRTPPPDPPYRGPAKFHGDNNNKPIHRIVIHSTVSPCVPGGAEAIATYFRETVTRPSSAHYVVDPSFVRQVVFDSTVAYHAPPNEHSIGIEMCDIPGPIPNDPPASAAFKAARRAWRWRKPNQRALLENTAYLTAELCAAYGVPVRFVGARALRAGRRGITTHNSVSRAFGQSTHWDPGFWPRRRFVRKVRAHYLELMKGNNPNA